MLRDDCYVGIKSCGCIVMLLMVRPRGTPKELAEELLEFASNSEGLKVESAVLDNVRERIGWECSH